MSRRVPAVNPRRRGDIVAWLGVIEHACIGALRGLLWQLSNSRKEHIFKGLAVRDRDSQVAVLRRPTVNMPAPQPNGEPSSLPLAIRCRKTGAVPKSPRDKTAVFRDCLNMLG